MHALDEAWETLKRDFDGACSQVARAARCQMTNELNQSFRRLRQYQTEGEWVSAILDAGSRFVQQMAVFTLNNGVATLRGQCKLKLPEHLSFAVASAGAFTGAVDTKDPVVALRTASEVTEALSTEETGERAHIFPITNGNRVVAILFAADQEFIDVNALELIANIASIVLERRANTALHAQIAPPTRSRTSSEATVNPTGSEGTSNGAAARATSKSDLPAWSELTEEQRNLHIRAQRFSRVKVAEMQLSRPEACRAGREENNLYVFLKPEIDSAREMFHKQFMTTPSMVDYLHLELVHTAAEGDEMKLGAEYPGQLL